MVPLKFICGLFAVVSEAPVVFILQQTSSDLHGTITCNGPDGKLQA